MSTTVPSRKSGASKRKRQTASSAANQVASTGRQRFLDACHARHLDHPPIWLMRQAGRALPEYRQLKEKHSFLEMVQTPELAAEVTIQPIRRFGFDAAILFSDILVAAEGLGQRYQFRDDRGIELDFTLNSAADIDRLEVGALTERLQYVGRALSLVKSTIGDRTAVLGFAGSPWTLANFMIEGGGVRDYTKARTLFYSEPDVFQRLMKKLTAAVTALLQLQINAGADAVQIFDSLGGLLSDGNFMSASGQWIRHVIASLKGRVPVILFCRGVHGNWSDLAGIGAQVLSVDWNVRLAGVRSLLPARIALQGNLDPFLLCTKPDVVAADTRRILREMKGRPGHIFNLGHGVPPGAKLENIESLVATVRSST